MLAVPQSPNVLLSYNDVLKITDFGISRQWNERSTKMSFAGTVAWMAPEVIRNELCSEKVDVWSFGVVLWELLTSEIPYKDVDSSAVIWGVGNNSLRLPIPSSLPDGFQILLRQCWSAKPKNRPTFRHILMHLDIATSELLAISNEKFLLLQTKWKDEICNCLSRMKKGNIPISCYSSEDESELIRKRNEELQHARDVREHYERKLDKANNLYLEVTACLLQLEQRERELAKREKLLASRADFSFYSLEDSNHHIRPPSYTQSVTDFTPNVQQNTAELYRLAIRNENHEEARRLLERHARELRNNSVVRYQPNNKTRGRPASTQALDQEEDQQTVTYHLTQSNGQHSRDCLCIMTRHSDHSLSPPLSPNSTET